MAIKHQFNSETPPTTEQSDINNDEPFSTEELKIKNNESPMTDESDIGNDETSKTEELTRDYGVPIHFIPKVNRWDPKTDWILIADFWCHDLMSTMRDGLFWSRSNIIPERGYYSGTQGTRFATTHAHKRVWELAEHPDGAVSSRWTATFTLYTHTVREISEFRFDNLSRANVSCAGAYNNQKSPNRVFHYSKHDPGQNYNCWDDKLQPRLGSWWICPLLTEIQPPAPGTASPLAVQGDEDTIGHGRAPETNASGGIFLFLILLIMFFLLLAILED